MALQVRDFVADAALAEAYGIDKIPALAIRRDGPRPKDIGIRFYGIPSGYEFGTLIEDILMLSRRDPGLEPETLGELSRLTSLVHIQVFVTPTCLYCPQAVHLAHQVALASDLITADMVEGRSFRSWRIATKSTGSRAPSSMRPSTLKAPFSSAS
ncbi:MAG: hypothetical protein AB1449_09385 [Chloroflexota bacterium]